MKARSQALDHCAKDVPMNGLGNNLPRLKSRIFFRKLKTFGISGHSVEKSN